MKNIVRIFSLVMTLCMCFGMMSTSTFAAEPIETKSENYLNYEFPEGSVVLYQGVDGVIYETESANTVEKNSTRSVEYNQVWLNAGKWASSSFPVTNPHPFNGNGFGRLRLESQDSTVRMQVTVSNGSNTLLGTTTIRVGTDVTFDFNTFGNEIIVHYSTSNVSNQYGMRLNCWLS